MQLRDDPDDVAAADAGNITILDGTGRRGIRAKTQRGKR